MRLARGHRVDWTRSISALLTAYFVFASCNVLSSVRRPALHVRSTAATDDNGACAKFEGMFTGENENVQNVCRYLDMLLPLSERARNRVEPGDDEFLLTLVEDVVVPACLLIAPGEARSTNTTFFKSKKTHLLYHNPRNRTERVKPGVPSLRVVREKLILSIWPLQLGTTPADPSEVLINVNDLEDSSTIERAKPDTFLPHELLSIHLWPTGHFVEYSGRVIAAAHQNFYQVGIFEGQSIDTLKQATTTGFEYVGGEDIGTLFVHHDDLYLSTRIAIPTHLHALSGHGYRNGAIFKITNMSSINVTHSFHGEKVLQLSDDKICCEECGGCYEDLQLSGANISADVWWNCDLPGNLTGWSLFSWSATLQSTCLAQALGSTKSAVSERFQDYMTCAHQCRYKNEYYHINSGNLHGRLFGLIGDRNNSNGYFCLLGDKSLKFQCFQNHFITLNHTLHPQFSSLVGTSEAFVIAEPFPQAEGPTTFLLHSWARTNFCAINSKLTSHPTTVKFHVKSPTRYISVLYVSEEYKSCTRELDGLPHISIRMFVFDTPLPLLRYFERVIRDEPLCQALFMVPKQCLLQCEVQLEFTRVRVHGIVSSSLLDVEI